MGQPLRINAGIPSSRTKAIVADDLRKGLSNQEFHVHYQPQVDLRSGRIVGVEALARWTHPEAGAISPAEFIPIAEETGLIVPIGEFVLRTACSQGAAWRKAGLDPITVAVNLSTRQFQQEDLGTRITHILDQTGLWPAELDLEITESHAMLDADFTLSVLKDLKAMGVRLSIDDFGTGYSSLGYLKQFPIDTIKIDRSFVKDLPTDAKDAAIVSAVIVLAHSLGLEVVAEGVETQDQLAILKLHQCDRMQGFLFSRGLTAADCERLLREPKLL